MWSKWETALSTLWLLRAHSTSLALTWALCSPHSLSLWHMSKGILNVSTDELQLLSTGLTDCLKQILSLIRMLLLTLNALQVHSRRPLAKDIHTTDPQPQAMTHYHHTLLKQRKHISCSSHRAGGTCHSSLVKAMADQILSCPEQLCSLLSTTRTQTLPHNIGSAKIAPK